MPTSPIPPRSGIYRMAEQAVGLPLPEYLAGLRQKRLSHRAIAAQLAAKGIPTTGETVRGWTVRLGIK